MEILEKSYLEDSGFRRKKFIYDKRIHHSYIFIAGGKVYTVVFGHLAFEQNFSDIGYLVPPGTSFPVNGISEVWFDLYLDPESFGDFRHVKFNGLAGGVVLEQGALAMLEHFQTFNIGGFVFQAATGAVVDKARSVTLEETYDYLLGLKNDPRYNKKTGLLKAARRRLIPATFNVYKDRSHGGACYVITTQNVAL